MRTQDRALSDVFTVAQIGRTQEVTPEGFLLCRDVPIARTGEMVYGPGEVPVEVGRDMIARITRGEDVLLAPDTLASYEGKAVTIDHPDEDVGPDNWRQLAVGHVRNVRAGDGIDGDKIMADLLITDRAAIDQVRDGLREVSCGYDAEYEDLGGGRGRQVSITGNHVALVARGRCGPVCSIGDSEMRTRDESQQKNMPAWKRRLAGLFRTGDEDAFVRELQGAPHVEELDGSPPDDKSVVINLNLAGGGAAADVSGDGVPDPAAVAAAANPADPMAAVMASLSAIEARLTALEGSGAAAEDPPAASTEDEPDEDGDGVPDKDDEDDEDPTKDSAEMDDGTTRDRRTKDAATRDSADLSDEFADTRARAEIIAPGISLPTFDSRIARKTTVDSMCALRRRALARVGDSHKKLIAPIVAGLDMKKATCDQVRTAFIGASELIRQSNDARQFIPKRPVRDAGEQKGIPTIAQINAANRARWAQKS